MILGYFEGKREELEGIDMMKIDDQLELGATLEVGGYNLCDSGTRA